MKSILVRITFFVLALLVGSASFSRWPFSHWQSYAQSPALQGAAALTHLKQTGQYDSLQAAVEQARFAVSRVERSPLGRAAWHAPNAAAGYDAYLTEDGVSIALRQTSVMSLRLRGIGYGAALHAVAAGEVKAEGQRFEIAREQNEVREWYVNCAQGLEQGFTLSEPPGGFQMKGQRLRLALALGEGWHAEAAEDGQRVWLRGASAGEVIEYGKLVVWDSVGKALPALLRATDREIFIEVDDSAARYPLTIDPVFALQQKLTSLSGINKNLGASVALHGNLAAVGVPQYAATVNANQGAVLIFVRTGTDWVQEALLVARDAEVGDQFGASVALHGETVLVGAPLKNEGAAYIFVRSVAPSFPNVPTNNATVWVQQQKLTAGGAVGDQFGTSVALNSNTAMVGAPFHDTSNVLNHGAVYVFNRNGLNWTPERIKLIPSELQSDDFFGSALALDGDTLAVGAPQDDVNGKLNQGSVTVFVRGDLRWSPQQLLTASDGSTLDNFGQSLALQGNNLLVGAPGDNASQGTVYHFTRSGTAWSQQSQFASSGGQAGEKFGSSVALNGTQAVIGAPNRHVGNNANQGAAFLFVRNDITLVWREEGRFIAADGRAQDRAGASVALSHGSVIIGAPDHAIGARTSAGAAYVYAPPGTPRVMEARLTTQPAAPAPLTGLSAVAIAGDVAVVGFPQAANGGAIEIYTRSGSLWTLRQRLNGIDTVAGDRFGSSVAISGDRILVGAPNKTVSNMAARGAAYLFASTGFRRWDQIHFITATDGEAGDLFGSSVALSNGVDDAGKFALIGAQNDTGNGRREQGSAYAFRFNANAELINKLSAADGVAEDHFGASVALLSESTGLTALIGAPEADFGTTLNQGAAYVYTNNGNDAVWTLQARFLATEGGSDRSMGRSVALNGNTALVGAPGTTFADRPGAAYVFVRNGATWTQQIRLTAPTPRNEDYFGASVALSEDFAVIGAPSVNRATSQARGAVYAFERRRALWSLASTFAAPEPEGAAADLFGGSVAVSGSSVIAYAQQTNNGAGGRAVAAYAFAPCRYTFFFGDNESFPAAGGSTDIRLTCSSNCGWTAQSSADWIQITSGASGLGNGNIRITIAPNTGLAPRGGSLYVNGTSLYIKQAGACTASLTPLVLPGAVTGVAYQFSLRTAGNTGTSEFRLIDGSTLPAGMRLSLDGTLFGTPTGAPGRRFFTVAALDANGCVAAWRYEFRLYDCSVTSVTSPNPRVNAAGGVINLDITAFCRWEASTSSDHAQFLRGTELTRTVEGGGHQTLQVSVAPNLSLQEGIEYVTVNNRLLTITQAAATAAENTNAGSYFTTPQAPDSILAAFGANLANATLTARTLPLPLQLGDTDVTVIDASGTERRAPLFFVSSGQVNYLLSAQTAQGVATVIITNRATGGVALDLINVAAVAPGIFAANATGNGVAAAQVLRVKPNGQQIYENVARFDQATQRFVPVPIDLTIAGDQVFLVLYGTGWRYRSALSAVNLRLAGTALNVAYAGATGFAGLDQINALLPNSFAGRGELDLTLSVDGRTANTVRLTFR